MANYLAPIINEQQFDANGDPLSGGEIFVYLAGTSTPATTYTTKAGGTPNTFPIDLNTLGVNEDGEVWLIGGSAYKFVIKDSAGVTLRTLDNISGINDTAITADQWVVYQSPPTYVSATSFTVAGDQTQTFQVRRRIKTTNTGGTIYSTITASSYGAPNTTVTVQNDSGVLDSGLSQVSYGLISVLDSSVIGRLLNVQVFVTPGAATYTPTPGTTRILVDGVGAGGAGAGSAVTGAGTLSVGSGGGAGAIGKTFLTSGFYPTVAVTIGAAGAGVSGANGNPGGASSFGAFLTLPGGTGGTLTAAAAIAGAGGGTGGLSSGGNLINQRGSSGEPSIAAFAATFLQSGAGGNGPFGGGGPSAINFTGGGAAATNGSSAISAGAGGGGGTSTSGGGPTTGGNGAGAFIVVYEYA
jgi:hypothetical protein